MLYVALGFSAVLLLVANVASWLPGRRVIAIALMGLGVSLAMPFFCMVALPPLIWQSGLLCVAGIAWKKWGEQRPLRYLALSGAATALAFAFAGLMVLPRQQEYSRLRERFPIESIEARVTKLPTRPETQPMTSNRLEKIELELDREMRYGSRAYQLRSIHEDSVKLFVNSPGFGVGRMPRGPSEQSLLQSMHREPAPVQPAEADPSSLWPQGSLPPFPDPWMMESLHFNGVKDFVNPQGFGYVKDRQHVVGFESHGFRQVPTSTGAMWEVGRLELASLLKHPEPRVYVTTRLPRMEELSGAKLRDLDGFESASLANLRRGDDLVVEGSRMMGAIRCAKQCQACHGGNRGDLLGAFSYTLRPTKDEKARGE